MATNREIVTDALREIAVLDADETASAEDAALGLRELNRLMMMLLADSVDLGFQPQDSLAGEFPLNEIVQAQVVTLLALRLTRHFPASTLAPSLIADAELARSQLLRMAVLANMEESVAAVPPGSGYHRRYCGI